MTRVTSENVKRQLIRLNSLTDKEYHIIISEIDGRYCLHSNNNDQITLWLKINEFWDCMYCMIRLVQHDKDKPRTWEII